MTNEIILTRFCRLELESHNGIEIWKQPSATAPVSQRLIFIQIEKESHDTLKFATMSRYLLQRLNILKRKSL